MMQSIVQPEKFMKNIDENVKIIADYDKNLLNYIGRLYNNLNGTTVNIDEVENIVDVLSSYKKDMDKSYLESLIHPEKAKGSKIPSPIPVPSTSFQLHNSATLSTNSSGNLLMLINPYFLGIQNLINRTVDLDPGNIYPNYRIENLGTFLYNNDDTLTGTSSVLDNTFKLLNIGQLIPDVYDQYRLVSASIVIKYIGRMDITSGVIGGAVIFNEYPRMSSTGKLFTAAGVSRDITTINGYSKFGNFDLAMDSYYHQENLCIEGLRMLYFPLDTSYEEYTKIFTPTSFNVSNPSNSAIEAVGYLKMDADEEYYKSGFTWMVYVLGAPPNSSCFKVDLYCNFECLPNSSFLNYIPISAPCQYISNEEKKSSIALVQSKPILKANEDIIITNKKASAWKQLKKAFQGALPSIGKLISKGIIQAIPYMKPGLAIAGTLLQASTTPKTNQNLNMSIEDVE